jgi:hypothetical protein
MGRWWWPRSRQGYWPPWALNEVTLEAFVGAFEGLGYSICAHGLQEPAIEKVALYVLGGKPTHAARQLLTGRWTSKLGESYDIDHTAGCLDGPAYGTVAVCLKRPRRHDFSHARIAQAAYAIWEREGKPHGCDKEHWQQAIQHLLEQQEAWPASALEAGQEPPGHGPAAEEFRPDR